ncbi:non-ribosomal peptide synthetase [Lentzea sp. NBRC 105346]|uniref:non-ribosomal peptide synthetase n=1 Tax=Lentzea sp. NBRC 105346 TaxID=3032205 RepID=UPI002556CEF0|nr:non-ribosomal peptide synthetase [Lentzea sp. NBRC 105346]
MGAIQETTLHELIAAQTRVAPSRIAVTGPDGDLTYGDLESRAERVADRLAALGVGVDRPVGLLVPRSAAMIVGMLGILRAGGAYLPLDPDHPDTRVHALLSAAGAAAVVTVPELAERAGTAGLPVVVLGEEGPGEKCRPTPGSALCYVLFTSGSTGAPKAVAVEHRQYIHYLNGLYERIEPGWSWALVSTFSADLGSTNVFGALTTGGRLHVLSREQAIDSEAFANYFALHRIDAMKLVPSHLAALAGEDVAGVLPRRLLICAGEPLTPNLVRRVRAARPDLAVENHYGPTETTVSMLAHRVPQEVPATIPLGRPFAGVRVHVLGPDKEPVEDGVTGELHITGGNLARGYLNAPAATAVAFPPCPAGPSGARMYATGDLVRRLPSGDLEFAGRVDDQVKVMGYRVEPSEVAAVLARHPSVGQAIVVPYGAAGELRLAGYVTGSGVTGADVRAFAADLLPEHMVPSAVVVLDALPLTSNGKIDRAALPAPVVEPTEHHVAPQTGLEEQVAAVWASTLKLAHVGVHDNFFDIGGTSLLLMRLRVRLIKLLDREISMVTLFRNPTVRLLARHLETAEAPALEADNGRGRSRLTTAARARRRAAMSGDER